MFWKKDKTPEQEKRKEMEDATKKIDGCQLWGYMVTRCGVVVDVLQNLRRVECERSVGGKPATMVRIFDPKAVEREGVVINGYESLDRHHDLILYEGYYRGADTEIGEIDINQVTHDKENA